MSMITLDGSAYRRGNIEACLPHDAMLPWVMALARYTGKSTRTIENMPPRDGYVYEQGNAAKLSASGDAGEAVGALVEQRAPVFAGR